MRPKDESKGRTFGDKISASPAGGSHKPGTGVVATAKATGGKSAAEAVSPRAEHAYWRANYETRDYFERGRTYTDYGPAYQFGWESRSKLGGRTFGDVESDLERGWHKASGASKLTWAQAKQAARDAWQRIERA